MSKRRQSFTHENFIFTYFSYSGWYGECRRERSWIFKDHQTRLMDCSLKRYFTCQIKMKIPFRVKGTESHWNLIFSETDPSMEGGKPALDVWWLWPAEANAHVETHQSTKRRFRRPGTPWQIFPHFCLSCYHCRLNRCTNWQVRNLEASISSILSYIAHEAFKFYLSPIVNLPVSFLSYFYIYSLVESMLSFWKPAPPRTNFQWPSCGFFAA